MNGRPIESEKELDSLLFSSKGAAAQCGWQFRYHVLRSKGSQAGFPDRVLVRERVIFVETKGPKTRVTPEQVGWLTALAKAGAECYLVRPDDLDEFVSVALAGRLPRQIAARWQPSGCRFDEWLDPTKREAAAA